MKELAEDLKTIFIILLFLFGIIFIPLLIVTPINYLRCSAQYENVNYSLFGGCLIEYQGKYIPEDLYKSAFEKNFNLNINK